MYEYETGNKYVCDLLWKFNLISDVIALTLWLCESCLIPYLCLESSARYVNVTCR